MLGLFVRGFDRNVAQVFLTPMPLMSVENEKKYLTTNLELPDDECLNLQQTSCVDMCSG